MKRQKKRKWKGKLETGRTHLQNTYLIKCLSHWVQLSGHEIWTDTSQKKRYKWTLSTRKDTPMWLITKKTRLKANIRHHSMCVKVVEKTDTTTNWLGYETQTLKPCWWKCKMVQTLWKNSVAASYKVKHMFTMWSTSPLLGIYPKINLPNISTQRQVCECSVH